MRFTTLITMTMICLSYGESASNIDSPIDRAVTAKVFFSSHTVTDTLSAFIEGPNYDAAIFKVVVERNGTAIYRFEVPIKEIIPTEYLTMFPENFDPLLSRLLNSTVYVRSSADIQCKRSWSGPGLWKTHPDCERYRRSGLPVVCHAFQHEGTLCVVFDPECNEVIELRRSGY